MTADELLADLRQRGVTVKVRDGRLACRPGRLITPELRERLAEHKPTLIERLLADEDERALLEALRSPA